MKPKSIEEQVLEVLEEKFYVIMVSTITGNTIVKNKLTYKDAQKGAGRLQMNSRDSNSIYYVAHENDLDTYAPNYISSIWNI